MFTIGGAGVMTGLDMIVTCPRSIRCSNVDAAFLAWLCVTKRVAVGLTFWV
jgi:hypothetical protein